MNTRKYLLTDNLASIAGKRLEIFNIYNNHALLGGKTKIDDEINFPGIKSILDSSRKAYATASGEIESGELNPKTAWERLLEVRMEALDIATAIFIDAAKKELDGLI